MVSSQFRQRSFSAKSRIMVCSPVPSVGVQFYFAAPLLVLKGLVAKPLALHQSIVKLRGQRRKFCETIAPSFLGQHEARLPAFVGQQSLKHLVEGFAAWISGHK